MDTANGAVYQLPRVQENACVSPREGVVKYLLDYRPSPLPANLDLQPLRDWFQRCRERGLIGRDPTRYDGLAYGKPTEHVPTVSGGRDEINSMAESLNALVDHRMTFLRWWKESMDEVSARHAVLAAGSYEEKDEAMQQLRRAIIARLELMLTSSERFST